MQRCLDHADSPTRAAIIEQVITHARKLVVDPFGNYVVQYVLDMGLDGISYRVMNTLRGSYPMLSLQKFSSNVIEKVNNRSVSQRAPRRADSNARCCSILIPSACKWRRPICLGTSSRKSSKPASSRHFCETSTGITWCRDY